MRWILVLSIGVVTLTGCGGGDGLSGSYKAEGSQLSRRIDMVLRFDGDTAQFIRTMDGDPVGEDRVPYRVDGDRLLLGAEGAEQQVYTINEDGTLSGGGQTWRKQG